jgi:hypothetical protein
MGRACSTNGAKRNIYRMLVGKPEGKRPLGRQRRRWVDNIKMNLREIGWGGVDWIDLVQDRTNGGVLVNTVMKLWVPWNAGKFLHVLMGNRICNPTACSKVPQPTTLPRVRFFPALIFFSSGVLHLFVAIAVPSLCYVRGSDVDNGVVLLKHLNIVVGRTDSYRPAPWSSSGWS